MSIFADLARRLPARVDLLPPEVRETLPAWRATADEEDPTATVKLFLPGTCWTWYIVEFDGEDTCFGLVAGQFTESGYFSLGEIETARTPRLGIPAERDQHFTPTPLSVLRRLHGQLGYADEH